MTRLETHRTRWNQFASTDCWQDSTAEHCTQVMLDHTSSSVFPSIVYLNSYSSLHTRGTLPVLSTLSVGSLAAESQVRLRSL
jgi:hypothetical protein